MYHEVVAEEPGYFYIYLSNDGTEGGEAFFDDFGILTLESYIVQQTDYYPYGLVARNFVREGEKETFDLFQGKTYEELTGWYDFHARQYDAALGRWFGVDPKASVMPYNSPYVAMMNNPVMFTDPDGECPICFGAAIGLITNGIFNTINGDNFFKDGFKAALFGAIGGGVSHGIGQLAQGLANAGWSQLGVGAFQAGTHAFSGGGLSVAQGGNFWHGFAAGGISSGVSSGIAAVDGGSLAQWVGGGLSGGIGSILAGGGFWQGMAQGLVTGGLNHAADKIQFELTKTRLITALKKEGLCTVCTDQEVGGIFEGIAASYHAKQGYVVTPGELLQTVFGNTIPDYYIGLDGDKTGKFYPHGGMVEVKAKNSGTSIGLHSQNGQLFKQIFGHSMAWVRGRGTHTLMTTGGVKISPMVRSFATRLGIRSDHYSSVYSGSLSIKNISFKRIY